MGKGTGTVLAGGSVGSFAGATAGFSGSGAGSGAPGFSFFFGLAATTDAPAATLLASDARPSATDGAAATTT
jgi:hypothetical protein